MSNEQLAFVLRQQHRRLSAIYKDLYKSLEEVYEVEAKNSFGIKWKHIPLLDDFDGAINELDNDIDKLEADS